MFKLHLKSKIFIDGGDPEESRQAKKILGHLDGQTTNPTLFAKNPEVVKWITKGKKFSRKEVYAFYKKVIKEFDKIIDWSISIEPYADAKTSSREIFSQAKEMARWSDKAWIKFPTTIEGLKAAREGMKKGIRCNMTLVFSQEQAAAVHAATRKAKKNSIFLSPFVGRLDDRREDGMQLIANILKMYEKDKSHVLTVTASVRNYQHFLYALFLKSPIITIPFKIFHEWAQKGFILPGKDFIYHPRYLKPIPYRKISLGKDWTKYDLHHDLTDIGIGKFAADWNSLVE